MPSNTPSPYSRPWSNTDTVAESRSRNFPSIHTTVTVVSRALGCLSIGQQRRDPHFRDPYARRLAGEQGEAILRGMKQGRRWAWPMIVRTAVMDEIILR